MLAGDADARPLAGLSGRAPSRSPPRARWRRCRGIARVDARERGEQDRAASATVRAIGPAVSCVADGDDAGAAHQPDRRLDADEPRWWRGRRSSRPSRSRPRAARSSPRPRRPSRSSSRRGCGRARTGCALAAAALQPLVDWSSGSSPTRAVGLAEDHRAGVAQALATSGRAAGSSPRARASPRWSSSCRAVSMLSLTRTGMPCSGPRGPFVFRSASSAAAMWGVGVHLDTL